MNDASFILLKIVISICAALFTAYVVPYISMLKNDKRYASAVEMVEIAVRAAEQTIKGSGQGTLKKSEVVAVLSRWMDEHGIYIDQEQLDQLIECAVYQLKQEQ